MAHRCQFSIVNLAGETDLHLGAREGIRVVVEPEYRAAKLVRYREMPDVEIKIGFHVFHVERLWGNRLLVVGSARNRLGQLNQSGSSAETDLGQFVRSAADLPGGVGFRISSAHSAATLSSAQRFPGSETRFSGIAWRVSYALPFFAIRVALRVS